MLPRPLPFSGFPLDFTMAGRIIQQTSVHIPGQNLVITTICKGIFFHLHVRRLREEEKKIT